MNARGTRWMAVIAAVLLYSGARAESPAILFDIPLIAECRDVTPKGFREAYKREIFEAVFKISPQLVAGDEKGLKRLHYEISTEQQMPVVGFLPNSQVGTDVVDGTIAIQNSSNHGEISFRYLVLPATGNGDLKGDLESSHAQFGLLAPRQLLLAAGTIERGCGVYFELRPSTQDTLQKQREFACLFDVPMGWRADFVTVRCQAKGTKQGLGGLLDSSEVVCGAGVLSVGLYRQDDGEARAYADMVARKQQAYFKKLTEEQSKNVRSGGPLNALTALNQVFSSTAKAKVPQTVALGAAVQSQLEQSGLATMQNEMKSTGFLKLEGDDLGAAPIIPQPAIPEPARSAHDELSAAKAELRSMNGKKN